MEKGLNNMSSLLSKLQCALNKVNGNTLLIDDDKGYDEYFCPKCNERVYEDEYNHKQRMCYQCWNKSFEE